jgi:eukaryotic-like serine/threonine-protein kinase
VVRLGSPDGAVVSDSLRPDPPEPPNSERTEFALDPTSHVPPDFWWGSGETRTFIIPTPDGGSTDPPPLPNGRACQPPVEKADPVPPRADPKKASQSPVGRYLLGNEIGRGGVAVVYDGWDRQLEREIAIKVLLEEHRDKPEVVQRFLKEARITSRLQHPGIVPVHEIGLSPDNLPFFVMRLIPGETLDQILKRRDNAAVDLPQLLAVFFQVCQAIAYAHSREVIHRDLKPANIMVGAFGVLKVMDWGLAKVLGEPDLPEAPTAGTTEAHATAFDPEMQKTLVGTVFGTPAYLPREQARGQVDRVDERADVFGLGSILCEILTGQPPYTGATGTEIYKKAVAGDIADAMSRLNACPVALDLISLAKWCLAPNPANRPANAGVVVEVMTAYMQCSQRRAEQDLVRFFDLSLDLFCIASTEGYFLRVNENFPRVLGYTAQELTSRPYIDFVHPDDRDRTGAETDRLAGGQPCLRFMNRYRHADGHYVWLEWNALAVPEERAVYGVARDVSERVALVEAHRRAKKSEFYLAEIVTSAEVAIYSTSLDGTVESWNPGAEQLFGYPAEEIIGQSILSLFPPGGHGEAIEILKRLRQGESVKERESIRRRKDGTLIHVSITVSPVKDESGQVIGISGISRDIGERKRAEAALQESEARLRAVVDHAVEAIITINAKGIIESLNPSAEEMFGYPAAEMLGQNVRMLMPVPHREQHDDYLEVYQRTGVGKIIGQTLELVGQRKDGTMFPLELSVTEIRVAGRHLFNGVVRDISARKKAEAAMAERLRSAAFVAATGVALTRGVDLRESLQDFVELAVARLDIAFARVWTLRGPGELLELQASAGLYRHLDGPDAWIRVGENEIGLIAAERKPHHTNVVAADERVSNPAWAAWEGLTSFAGCPLLIGDRVVGVMAVFGRQPLSDNIIETLQSVADSVALAIRRHQLEQQNHDLRATGSRGT